MCLKITTKNKIVPHIDVTLVGVQKAAETGNTAVQRGSLQVLAILSSSVMKAQLFMVPNWIGCIIIAIILPEMRASH